MNDLFLDELDRMSHLQADISTLDEDMINANNRVNIEKLKQFWQKIGVKKLTPSDVINSHIIPTLQLDDDKLIEVTQFVEIRSNGRNCI